jgi:hypothetical protein
LLPKALKLGLCSKKIRNNRRFSTFFIIGNVLTFHFHFVINVLYHQSICYRVIQTELLEIVFTDFNILISWMMLTEEFEPFADDRLTNAEVFLELSYEEFVARGVTWAE